MTPTRAHRLLREYLRRYDLSYSEFAGMLQDAASTDPYFVPLRRRPTRAIRHIVEDLALPWPKTRRLVEAASDGYVTEQAWLIPWDEGRPI